ncbi:MAG: replicative DNA helicase [Candidatus Bipolaricaulia bacterium]
MIEEHEREFPRPLPRNREAEQLVLGAALVEPETTLPAILTRLKPEDFYWQPHQLIYRAILELFEKGKPPDLITVANRLEELGQLQAAGGRVYLSELCELVTTTASVEYYAEIVKKKAILRALIAAGKAVSELGFNEEEELEVILDRAEEAVFGISRFGTESKYYLISDFLHEHISSLERLHRDPEKHVVTGLATGFKEFDALTAGLQPSDLIIIAGRPAMGKCLRGDQKILDPITGALVPIAQFASQSSHSILTLGENYKLALAPVIRVFERGPQPVYRLVTSSGREIVATANHPFLTLSGWRELRELRPGDRLAVPRQLPVFGPKRVPAHQAKLLGYLLGDGTLSRSSVLFTNDDEGLIEDFRACVEAFPCATTRIMRAKPKGSFTLRVIKDDAKRKRLIGEFQCQLRAGLQAKGLTKRQLSLQLGFSACSVHQWLKARSLPRANRVFTKIQEELGVQLPIEQLAYAHKNDLSSVAKWLRKLGLLGVRAAEKRIPDEVFTWDRESLKLFLNRLFACDGSLYVGRRLYGLSFCSASKELAKGVQHLLLRFGILTKVRRKRVRYQGGERTAWEVEVRDAQDIRRFIQEIGIYGAEDKISQVLKALEDHHISHHTNVDVVPSEIWGHILGAKAGLLWKDLTPLLGYPKNHNKHVGRGSLGRGKLEKLARAIQAQTALLDLERPSPIRVLIDLSQSDVFWDRIESIEDAGVALTYDLEVESTHNFVAEDIIVHNSSLALSIARNVAIREGKGVGIFSLEMTKEQLLERLLAGEAKINLHQLRSGFLPAEKWRAIAEAAAKLAKSRIVIDDTPGISIMELKGRARRMKSEHEIDLLIVDYLQLVESGLRGTNSTREQEISHIARGLKALARELQVPLIACSQLSRAPERREAHRPRLSDLRESGEIEQTADVVTFIYRESYYDEEEGAEKSEVSPTEVIIGKQRNGPTGSLTLSFHRSYASFYEFTPQRPPF